MQVTKVDEETQKAIELSGRAAFKAKVQDAIANQDWKVLGMAPKPNCKSCYGRGYSGILSKTQEFILCHCLRKKFLKEEEIKIEEEQCQQDTQKS